ncbi:MAG: insulinase family protein [Pseudomonadales bacterium]|nr:insulinase family protein [Pseudomonadales bacterium]
MPILRFSLPAKTLLFALLSTLFISLLTACSPQTGESTPAPVAGTAANPGYSRINPVNAEDPLAAHIFQLDNGLQVFLSENHEEPRFYAEIAVKAGSKQDPADATGLAHYLEHLLFKGTEELGTLDYSAEKPYLDQIETLYEQHFNTTDPAERARLYAEINRTAQLAANYAIPNEIDQLYGSMGANALNAHTWHEETVYKVGLPSNRLRQWARLEANRFVNPVFRLFHTELETVYEELNRSLDNKDRVSAYALGELLYKQHPYGQQPTIGLPEHLKNPSLVYIRDFFDTYYVPNNMAIFISGDIDIDETIAVIAAEFAHWENKPVPQVGPWVEADIQGVERQTVSYPGEEEVQIAFRTVPNDHPDKEALMLFDMILDNRTAGLINLNLNQSQRVQAAGSSPQFLNDYGSQTLWGVPRAGQTLAEVEQLLLEQIELIKRGEFEDWIIPAIVNDFKKTQKRALESNTARVSTMRQAFLTEVPWEYILGEIERLEQVSKDDIIRVANQYFQQNYVAVHRVDGPQDIPVVEKPQIDPVSIDPGRQSQFAAQIEAMPFEPIEPSYITRNEDYQIVEYTPGVTLYYSQNPLNDLFSFSLTVEIGTEENDALGLATALVEKSGTSAFSPLELQKQWYRLGTEFSIGAGASESAVSITGLDEQFAASLDLMLALINEPQADPQTLEDLKTTILKSREDQKQDPRAISQALFLYNRYGEESPMLRALSSAQIKAATVAELLALTKSLPDYKHSLSYTGSLPLEEVLAILRTHHRVDPELRDPPPYRYRYARETDATEILLVDRESAQAQVRIEFPDGTYDESLSVPASLYNDYFGGGMSSVVFQELREARALAYSAGAQYSQGSRQQAENLVLGAIGTQNDKAAEATIAFMDLFDNMPRSAERFQNAKNSLENRYRTSTISFRQVLGTVRSWERLGINADPRARQFAELQSSTLEDLLNFQQQHVANKPKLVSIVGDMSRIDVEALRGIGTIREMDVDQLFVD